jgi:hypothetical protein
MWLRCEICDWPRYGGGQPLLVLEGVRLCQACYQELEPRPTVEDQRRRRLDIEAAA